MSVALAVTAVVAAVVILLLRSKDEEGAKRPAVVIGDFESSLSPWGTGAAAAPAGGLAIVRSPVAHGQGALRARVTLGVCIPADQHPDGTCKRYHSNAVLKEQHYEGKDAWWGWSIYFPADWTPNVLRWNLLAQFHPPATAPSSRCQPNVTLGTAGLGRLFVRSRGGATCAAGTTTEATFGVGTLGRWHRVVWHVRFSSGEDGLLEAWWDGVQVASLSGPTIYGELRYAYGPILGLYEGGLGATPQEVFYDYAVTGASYEAVADVPGAGG